MSEVEDSPSVTRSHFSGLLWVVHRLGLLAVSVVGLPFVPLLRLGAPAVDPRGGEQGWVVAVPFTLLWLGCLAVGWGREAWIRPWLRPGAGSLPVVAGLLLVVGGLLGADLVPDAFASVAIATWSCLAGLTLWARWGAALAPLFLAAPITLLATCVFAYQWSDPTFGGPAVRWGDPTTLLSAPTDLPLELGPGGRLRPNLRVPLQSAESPQSVRLITNSQGFRSFDEVGPKLTSEVRVLNLGDAFSLGAQIDQRSFLGPMLEIHLGFEFPRKDVRVLSADIADPVHGLLYLQEHGAQHKLDFVVLGLSPNDMLEADELCGDDRRYVFDGRRLVPHGGAFNAGYVSRYSDFCVEGSGHAPQARSSEPRGSELGSSSTDAATPSVREKLVRLRFVREVLGLDQHPNSPAPVPSLAAEYEAQDGRKRLLDGTLNLGYFLRRPTPIIASLHRKLERLLDAYSSWCREHGATFVVLVHPQRFQVYPEDWQQLCEEWQLRDEDFDLGLYQQRLAGSCQRLGIPLFDPLEPMRRAPAELYLPGRHVEYGSRAHALVARELAEFLGR